MSEVGQDEDPPLSPRSHAGVAGPSALAGEAGPSELPDASRLTREVRDFIFSLNDEQREILQLSYSWSSEEHEVANQVLLEEFKLDGSLI